PQERAESFALEFGEASADSRNGAWYIDLAAANRNILAAEGLTHIHTHPECTCCDTRFSSYRRQGKDSFTRMLALCG
ncbi:MAG: laccase domain-containing protein, partial [Spirochaetales bacterium]|nr:laccase domain-containing protein [Spirochaetales bacterium]